MLPWSQKNIEYIYIYNICIYSNGISLIPNLVHLDMVDLPLLHDHRSVAK